MSMAWTAYVWWTCRQRPPPRWENNESASSLQFREPSQNETRKGSSHRSSIFVLRHRDPAFENSSLRGLCESAHPSESQGDRIHGHASESQRGGGDRRRQIHLPVRGGRLLDPRRCARRQRRGDHKSQL